MLRGCQKRIYYMKNPGSKYFEEAYLILKKDAPQSKNPALSYDFSRDLASEADRIVRDACNYFSPPPKTRLFGRAAAFALGAASSSALIGTVALVLSFA